MGERTRFVVHLAKSRWLVVVAAIWMQCSCGVSYAFGIYSQTIKDTFDYDQKSLDTLASWKDLGSNIGIVSGLVFDWFSPRSVLAIGAVQSGVAYMLMWLSVTGRVAAPEFWQMCLYTLVGANGQTFFSTGSVVTCVQIFPRNRGVVIGLLKGALGLSGAILTQFYHAAYGDNPSSFILMVACLPTVIALVLMVVVRPVPAREEPEESKNLFVISVGTVCLAAFLMGVIVLDSTTDIGQSGHILVCLVIGVMLLLPLGVVLKSELKYEGTLFSLPSLKEPLLLSNSETVPSLAHPVAVPPSKLSESIVPLPEEATLLDEKPARKGPLRGEEHNIPQALAKMDFWLLFLAMACGMGSGLTAIDNTGQIGASLGYNSVQVGTFISLFSIWNFLGRLGFGALSELCLHKYQIGRPALLAFSQGVMALGYILISSALPGALYPALIIVGLCYGAQWSLMPAITSELFGLRRFATLFNTISVASPAGAYWLSVQVAGRLYDAEAEKGQVHSDEGAECHGAHCFRLTFIILAAVSVFGCMVCGLLVHRTKMFYARIIQTF